MRRNPSTVVVLAGETSPELLGAIGRSMNVTLLNAEGDGLDSALGSLRHGPWWPPLDEIIATARTFYPATL